MNPSTAPQSVASYLATPERAAELRRAEAAAAAVRRLNTTEGASPRSTNTDAKNATGGGNASPSRGCAGAQYHRPLVLYADSPRRRTRSSSRSRSQLHPHHVDGQEDEEEEEQPEIYRDDVSGIVIRSASHLSSSLRKSPSRRAVARTVVDATPAALARGRGYPQPPKHSHAPHALHGGTINSRSPGRPTTPRSGLTEAARHSRSQSHHHDPLSQQQRRVTSPETLKTTVGGRTSASTAQLSASSNATAGKSPLELYAESRADAGYTPPSLAVRNEIAALLSEKRMGAKEAKDNAAARSASGGRRRGSQGRRRSFEDTATTKDGRSSSGAGRGASALDMSSTVGGGGTTVSGGGGGGSGGGLVGIVVTASGPGSTMSATLLPPSAAGFATHRAGFLTPHRSPSQRRSSGSGDPSSGGPSGGAGGGGASTASHLPPPLQRSSAQSVAPPGSSVTAHTASSPNGLLPRSSSPYLQQPEPPFGASRSANARRSSSTFLQASCGSPTLTYTPYTQTPRSSSQATSTWDTANNNNRPISVTENGAGASVTNRGGSRGPRGRRGEFRNDESIEAEQDRQDRQRAAEIEREINAFRDAVSPRNNEAVMVANADRLCGFHEQHCEKLQAMIVEAETTKRELIEAIEKRCDELEAEEDGEDLDPATSAQTDSKLPQTSTTVESEQSSSELSVTARHLSQIKEAIERSRTSLFPQQSHDGPPTSTARPQMSSLFSRDRFILRPPDESRTDADGSNSTANARDTPLHDEEEEKLEVAFSNPREGFLRSVFKDLLLTPAPKVNAKNSTQSPVQSAENTTTTTTTTESPLRLKELSLAPASTEAIFSALEDTMALLTPSVGDHVVGEPRSLPRRVAFWTKKNIHIHQRLVEVQAMLAADDQRKQEQQAVREHHELFLRELAERHENETRHSSSAMSRCDERSNEEQRCKPAGLSLELPTTTDPIVVDAAPDRKTRQDTEPYEDSEPSDRASDRAQTSVKERVPQERVPQEGVQGSLIPTTVQPSNHAPEPTGAAASTQPGKSRLSRLTATPVAAGPSFGVASGGTSASADGVRSETERYLQRSHELHAMLCEFAVKRQVPYLSDRVLELESNHHPAATSPDNLFAKNTADIDVSSLATNESWLHAHRMGVHGGLISSSPFSPQHALSVAFADAAAVAKAVVETFPQRTLYDLSTLRSDNAAVPLVHSDAVSTASSLGIQKSIENKNESGTVDLEMDLGEAHAFITASKSTFGHFVTAMASGALPTQPAPLTASAIQAATLANAADGNSGTKQNDLMSPTDMMEVSAHHVLLTVSHVHPSVLLHVPTKPELDRMLASLSSLRSAPAVGSRSGSFRSGSLLSTSVGELAGKRSASTASSSGPSWDTPTTSINISKALPPLNRFATPDAPILRRGDVVKFLLCLMTHERRSRVLSVLQSSTIVRSESSPCSAIDMSDLPCGPYKEVGTTFRDMAHRFSMEMRDKSHGNEGSGGSGGVEEFPAANVFDTSAELKFVRWVSASDFAPKLKGFDQWSKLRFEAEIAPIRRLINARDTDSNTTAAGGNETRRSAVTSSMERSQRAATTTLSSRERESLDRSLSTGATTSTGMTTGTATSPRFASLLHFHPDVQDVDIARWVMSHDTIAVCAQHRHLVELRAKVLNSLNGHLLTDLKFSAAVGAAVQDDRDRQCVRRRVELRLQKIAAEAKKAGSA